MQKNAKIYNTGDIGSFEGNELSDEIHGFEARMWNFVEAKSKVGCKSKLLNWIMQNSQALQKSISRYATFLNSAIL